MVGTGVFTSLGFQIAEFQSGFLLLLLWAVGGLAALCGAMSYAELGAALPRSGGEYNFLGRIYHPAAGFVSGWVSATIGFAAPTALAAITFGAYLTATIGVEAALATKALASGLVIALALVHATTREKSGGIQLIFTVLKVAVIIMFCVAAIILSGQAQNIRFIPAVSDGPLLTSGAFAIALIYVSYAYTGWNVATYISGEIEDPKRNLPRILLTGAAIVTVLYLALNYVFLRAAPMDAMEGQVEIGFIAAQYLFGEGPARFTGAVLSLLLISTVSAMIIAGPRVLHAIGEDYPLFRAMGRANKSGVPAVAIFVQAGVAVFFIITSSFQSILIFSGFLLALNSFLAVAGLFVLRAREPDLTRPYRVTLFPVTPIIYLALTGWTLVYVVIDRPIEAALACGLIAAGVGAYVLVRRKTINL
ncbi:MAG: amino acid permease [Marinicaulis sp.]|nr:amino acid permease [Marinicaulis sp.]